MGVMSPQGTLLKKGTGSGPVVYTTVAQRVSIEGPEFSRADVKTTDLDTTVAHTFRPSALYDPGEISMKVYYDPKNTSQQALTSELNAGTQVLAPWRLEFQDTTQYDFQGFVSKFKPSGIEAGDEDNVQAEVTIKLSGEIVITPGA